jgi:Tol biopolymer transport system component
MINHKKMQLLESYPKSCLTMIVLLYRLVCLALLLALASCSGGNTLVTGSPSPTPLPSPAPSPTPTPTSQSGTIAFVSRRALDGSDNVNINLTANVWTVGPAGTNLKPLTRMTAAGADTLSASFSPDGRKLAFVSTRALDGSDAANSNGTPNVWIMNPDGSGVIAISSLKNVGDRAVANLQWSPDGTKLAFESTRPLDGSDAPELGNPFNIWVMKADGSSPTPLTRNTLPGTDVLGPFWSPDGTKLTFATFQNAFMMNADGSAVVQLTKITAFGVMATSPLWSPDGTRLSFMSNQALDGSDAANLNFTNNIWVMKSDGSGATPITRLTAFGANALGGIWSPDSSKLLFISERALNGTDLANATTNVWVVNADGTGASPLTKLTAVGAATGEFPAWSIDGSKIAFASSRALDGTDAENNSRTMNVWVMHSDGSTPAPLTNLTKVPSDSPVPVWQP